MSDDLLLVNPFDPLGSHLLVIRHVSRQPNPSIGLEEKRNLPRHSIDRVGSGNRPVGLAAKLCSQASAVFDAASFSRAGFSKPFRGIEKRQPIVWHVVVEFLPTFDPYLTE